LSDRPLLLLWDIDGTLLQRASAEHALALKRALGEVHGVEVTGLKVHVAGRTDAAIARDLLAAAGVQHPEVDARSQAVREACCRLYAELCPPDLSHTISPGIRELLAELAALPDRFRLSLLTGNFEPVARLKLDRAGLGEFFTPGQGAFGSDAEEREELPPVARARAAGADGDAPWPRERTVIIGDTPRDIAAARADRLRCVAVATGPYGVDELAGADHVAPDAHAVAAWLRSGL
jgi:phosphoglycolate phosphatase